MSGEQESAAWRFLEKLRWPDGPVCPHCGSVNHAYYIAPQRGVRTTKTGGVSYRRLWKCADCHKSFSVLIGTMMEDSPIPISKWLLANNLLHVDSRMTAQELADVLCIGYRAAWFMRQRIRKETAVGVLEHIQGLADACPPHLRQSETGQHLYIESVARLLHTVIAMDALIDEAQAGKLEQSIALAQQQDMFSQHMTLLASYLPAHGQWTAEERRCWLSLFTATVDELVHVLF